MSGYIDTSPVYGYAGREAVTGMELTVTPGVWDDLNGEPTVVGVWMDWNDEPVTAPGVLTFEVPEFPQPMFYSWRETATQAGRSETYWVEPFIEVIPPPDAPVFSGVTTFITGSRSVGATVTKPVYNWWSPLSVTTAGEWYKNGVATGVTASTYNNTQEGDILYWREIATDALGTPSIPSTGIHPGGESIADTFGFARFAVGNMLQTYATNMTSSIDTRIAGKAGGSTNMKLFSTKNHDAYTYVYNENLWIYDLRQQLSGRAIYKGGMNSGRPEDYGGVLITPRHLLYCRHAFPHAENTWIYPSGPCNVRFIKQDNTMVEAIQIHQQSLPDADLCVAVLDRDVQALGVNVIPICPFSYLEFNTLKELSGPSFPVFSISQGYNSPSNEPWSPLPLSAYDYPNHDVLCYIADLKNMRQNSAHSIPAVTTYLHYNFGVYDGDSGTPAFFILNNQIYLFQITTAIWSGPFVPMHIASINAAIAQADANAIALGRLASPTGLTVAQAPKPVF